MAKKKKRVLVGMSGGVDSSVTAALLQKRGYDVIGITMQLLPKEEERKSACCNLGAVNDAKQVCHKLNIPHYTINSRDNFQAHVIDDFINKYATGLTPNPCVECNRSIKFDELWQKADELEADFMATGHYSKITYSAKSKRYFLKKAADPNKDQSYFLYMLNQDTLSKLKFPLGGFLKPEIRKIAEELDLINAKKADSQEICFVSSKSYKDYVKTHIPDAQKIPGNIIDNTGKILGKHEGIYNFTIGQKKGLNLGIHYPLYVQHINPKTHEVTVGHKGDLIQSTIYLQQVSLIDEEEAVLNKNVAIKFRYQMPPCQATVIEKSHDSMSLRIATPQEFIAPGQSCVLYDKDRIIGGGIIQSQHC